MKKSNLFIEAMLLSICFFSKTTHAVTIDAWPDLSIPGTFGAVNPFGEILGNYCSLGGSCSYINSHHDFASYYGQTFLAPSGLAETLKIRINVSDLLGNDGIDFRLLITETTRTGNNFLPTNVIFESELFTIGNEIGIFGLQTGPDPTLPIGGIDLIDGQTYAWILDSVSAADGFQGFGYVGSRHPQQADFHGGALLANFDLEKGALDQPWLYVSQLDFAYQMDFSPGGVASPDLNVTRTLPSASVPEPSTLALMILGLVSVRLPERKAILQRFKATHKNRLYIEPKSL